MELLAHFCDLGGAVLMITHDMDIVERYAERSVVLANGRVLDDILTENFNERSKEEIT
jgi:ABC-type glutathione transport system ATPase component